MKKYRLKEEVKKYFDDSMWDLEFTYDDIHIDRGVSLNALEEVPQRIELRIGTCDKGALFKTSEPFCSWTDQEKDLCEKALNGELLDIDSLDSEHFNLWWNRNRKPFQSETFVYLLKQYLKEKK